MQNAATARRIVRSVQIEMALEKRAIGRRIAKLRDAKHLTQQEAADLTGVSIRTLQDWEYGKSQPRYRNLERLANTLGVPEDRIIASTEHHSPNGNQPDVLGRLERIEQLLQGLTDSWKEEITLGAGPRLERLEARVAEALATPPQADPKKDRRRKPA